MKNKRVAFFPFLLCSQPLCTYEKKRWKEAWELVARDPTAPYNFKVVSNDGSMKLPLQKLCRMVKFIDHIEDEEFVDGEYSYFMKEEIFDEEDRKMNQEIYKLARFMIVQSQTVETPIYSPSFSRVSFADSFSRVSFANGVHFVRPFPSELHTSILTLGETLLLDGNSYSSALESWHTPLHALFGHQSSADTTLLKIIFECCPVEKSSVTASATARDLV